MGGRASRAGYRVSRRAVPETPKVGGWQPTSAQLAYEERIRQSEIEYGAYFDSEGNLLLEGVGNADEIEFDPHEMNHKIEQRIWNDEMIDFVHNHPENTIFSPDDIETFEVLEARSERAVLANGVNYTLIRNQPRTSNVLTWNDKTGQFEREWEVKKISDAYKKAYSNYRDTEGERLKRERGDLSYEKRQQMKWDYVTKKMEEWLKKNARKYGYIFRKDGGK